MEKARDPFKFYTRLNLSEMTGLRANSLKQLAEGVMAVPDSCIYHHTHRFLQQHQYLSPEPPNDFAYWVRESLGERELGEQLESVDTVQFSTIKALRDKIVAVIEGHIKDDPESALRTAHEGQEFHFIKSVSFILPTNFVANDLREFAEMLERISVNSIYFHIFEARLRLEKSANDFSNWVENSVGDKKLASDIARLDPYTYTMEELRHSIIKIVKKRVGV